MNPESDHIGEHLLLQYLTGRTNAEERAAVESWLQESEAHRETLNRLEQLWLETGRLNPPPLAVDTDAAWNRMERKMRERSEQAAAVPVKKISFPDLKVALRAAAVILLVAGIAALIRWWSAKPATIGIAAADTVLRDTLPDGSLIALNSRSRLSFPETFRDDARRVNLTGEAFFEVTRDSLQPFIIDAGRASIKVLGTSFRVKAWPGDDLEVHVVTGHVLLFRIDPQTADTLSLILHAGEEGVLKTGARAPERKEERLSDDLFWANRTLEFSGTPLPEVIRMLEKHYGIHVTVSSPEVMNCRLTATFLDDPPARIMTVIAESFGLQLTVDGTNYHLIGDGCAGGDQ